MHFLNMCIENKVEMELFSYKYVPSPELDTHSPLVCNGGNWHLLRLTHLIYFRHLIEGEVNLTLERLVSLHCLPRASLR